MTDDATTTVRLDTTDPDRPRGDVRGLGDARRSAVHDHIVDQIVDHPMWIGDDGKPLDYLPEREARLADFIDQATDALEPMVAGWLAEAWAEGHNAAVVNGIEARAGAGEVTA